MWARRGWRRAAPGRSPWWRSPASPATCRRSVPLSRPAKPRPSDEEAHPMTNPLLVETGDGIAWLRFNRPERLNAIDVPMAEALRDAVAGLAADPTLRCVVLAGAG